MSEAHAHTGMMAYAQLDPTRTTGLRNAFARDMKKRTFVVFRAGMHGNIDKPIV